MCQVSILPVGVVTSQCLYGSWFNPSSTTNLIYKTRRIGGLWILTPLSTKFHSYPDVWHVVIVLYFGNRASCFMDRRGCDHMVVGFTTTCVNKKDRWFMDFNATFNKISFISWRSVLLVEETGENHRSSASHWQTLWHNVKSSTSRHELSGIQSASI
jgi:hypothetical protein